MLGKAKVMSYEDLEVAWVKRVAKESIKAAKSKGKRNRKSKNSLLEQEDNNAKIARRGWKRKSVELEVLEPTSKIVRTGNVPKPVSALVI